MNAIPAERLEHFFLRCLGIEQTAPTEERVNPFDPSLLYRLHTAYGIGLLLHFVCHFNPPLNHRRQRKTDSKGGRRTTPPQTTHLFTVYERYRKMRCHFCVTRNRSLSKREMKGENGLLERNQQTTTAHEVTAGRFLKFFFFPFFFCFRSCLNKKIGAKN